MQSLNAFLQSNQSNAWGICLFLLIICIWLSFLYIKLKKRYFELAKLNPHTQLENKLSTLAKLDSTFHAAKRYQHPLTIGILQIPQINKLESNDNQNAANQCLNKISRVLQQELRNADHLGHYKQGQFLLALTNTNSHNARAVFNRLVQKLEQIKVAHHNLTCYLGYANCNKDTPTLTAFIGEAENALQQTYAKDSKNILGYHTELS